MRGADAYTPHLLAEPGDGKIVGVAEPNPVRRKAFAERYGIPAEACFDHYRALLEADLQADYALVATPDSEHTLPAHLALEHGLHVLLEKPMATTLKECEALVAAAERADRLLQICHVLRYAPLYETVKAVIEGGELGELVTIQHSENVSHWHYAHSYCRGTWRNSNASSPMILAKSCHDMDLLYWLADAPPARLTSIASPTRLTAANAPTDAPEFCIEGCSHATSCAYDAVATYQQMSPLLLDLALKTRAPGAVGEPASLQPEETELPRASGWNSWPVSAITDDTSELGIEHALRTTNYGRCVDRIPDADQPASQHVGVSFTNGVTASFTMHSTSHREGRETRIDGTRGSLVAGFYTLEHFVEVTDHKTGRTRSVDVPVETGIHGGGDPRLFRGFLAAIRGEAAPLTTAAESLWSHRMAFDADRAAREGIVVEWKQVPTPTS